ncbi:TPA: DUF1090 domain-containing protein [Providencia alcalifaciens]
MKRVFIISSILALFLVNNSAMAGNSSQGCEIKKQKIETQLKYAKAHGNTYRVNGLERALENVNRYCTSDSLYRDSQQKIAEKQEKVAEREAELQESIQKGDPEKIAKHKRKVAEAKAELKEAQELSDIYKDTL